MELARAPLVRGPEAIGLIADALEKVWENLQDMVGLPAN